MVVPARRKRRLWDAFVFAGFRPEGTVRGIFGDPKARIIRLRRRSKKHCAAVVDACTRAGTIVGCVAYAICRAPIHGSISNSMRDAFAAGHVAK
jgi:hypothetical protein